MLRTNEFDVLMSLYYAPIAHEGQRSGYLQSTATCENVFRNLLLKIVAQPHREIDVMSISVTRANSTSRSTVLVHSSDPAGLGSNRQARS
jgi:hypothetical protein